VLVLISLEFLLLGAFVAVPTHWYPRETSPLLPAPTWTLLKSVQRKRAYHQPSATLTCALMRPFKPRSHVSEHAGVFIPSGYSGPPPKRGTVRDALMAFMAGEGDTGALHGLT